MKRPFIVAASQSVLFCALLLLSPRSTTSIASSHGSGGSCWDSEVDCGYFGCFPSGSGCPLDCETFETQETCHAIQTADNRQACRFNPQHSLGSGLCQKVVKCYDLGDNQCSENCFHCWYLGCLPDGTSCPAYCNMFGDATACASNGGVAGGMACQWNTASGVCDAVPLAQTGVQQVNWVGAKALPGRLAMYIGFFFAAVGVICVTTLLYRQQAIKRRRNKILAADLSAEYHQKSSRPPSLFSKLLPTERIRTRFHRESLIVHIRGAVGLLGKSQVSPLPLEPSPGLSPTGTSSGVMARSIATDSETNNFRDSRDSEALHSLVISSPTVLPRKPSAAASSPMSWIADSGNVNMPHLDMIADEARKDLLHGDSELSPASPGHHY